ncbi:MAG TPA: L-histidine N(alpha)-methyltransferase [Burkholderiales bacterium]|jgi:L-histidine Nalpha-methyltransferase|nr:L-histidine N(alpha)-methyltransferase [Burkholderiales bacterium]
MKNSATATREGRAVAKSPSAYEPRFLHDVLHGLSQPQKSVPPKYFYDACGSELFEAICATPEYYPTRTEMRIMAAHVREMADTIGPEVELIELGSGASLKTRLLIEALRPHRYVPIDVSHSALAQACGELNWRFPYLTIEPYAIDFTAAPLPERAGHNRLVYFPGSTIGNFHPNEAVRFLRGMRGQFLAGEALLIGVDLKKDGALLNAAYNDAQGITAAFNLNLLQRMNAELDGDFDLEKFRHLAFYNAECGWVEMHLQSLVDQDVCVAGHRFRFRAEETLHTEISCKYSVREFQALAADAGFYAQKTWTDERGYFSVHLMRAA